MPEKYVRSSVTALLTDIFLASGGCGHEMCWFCLKPWSFGHICAANTAGNTGVAAGRVLRLERRGRR